jgi:hypothetical protein
MAIESHSTVITKAFNQIVAVANAIPSQYPDLLGLSSGA